MPDKNPNWGGARAGAGRPTMALQMPREDWETIVRTLRDQSESELAAKIGAWLARVDASNKALEDALAKVHRKKKS